jgi:hypothetical protein
VACPYIRGEDYKCDFFTTDVSRGNFPVPTAHPLERVNTLYRNHCFMIKVD